MTDNEKDPIDLGKILLPKKETPGATTDSAQRINAGALLAQEQNATLLTPKAEVAPETPPPPTPPVDDPTVQPLQTYRSDIESLVQKGGVSERLLIPREIRPVREAIIRLELRMERLAAMGIVVEPEGDKWFLRAIPAAAAGLEQDLVQFLETGEGDADGFEKTLWADLACKAAVKDNSVLDEHSARSLLSEAFALENPRCPHGRPIWFQVSRVELFELVGRTV